MKEDFTWKCPKCGATIGKDYTECSMCGYGKPEKEKVIFNEQIKKERSFDRSIRSFRTSMLREMSSTVAHSRSIYAKNNRGWHKVAGFSKTW